MLIYFSFVLGASLGSFLGVLFMRIPQGKSVVFGRSYCEDCKHRLSILDLIPIVSFILLKGRCRYCKAKLSYIYPLIELLTGAIFAYTVYQFLTISDFSLTHIANFMFMLIIASSIIVIFFTDLKYGVIPDKVLFPSIIVLALYLLVFLPSSISNHLLSAIGAFLFFVVIFVLTKGRGMGFGDVKFAFLVGFLLGFPLAIFSLYLAFLTGSIVSIILILRGKKRLKGSKIAFGPFMAASALVCLYFGKEISDIFLRLLNLK